MSKPFFDPTDYLPKSHGMDVLALSPMVMAMRAPQMMFEMAWPFYGSRKDEGERAVFEKAAAIFESFGAVQAEMMQAYLMMSIGAWGGQVPDPKAFAQAWQDILDAGLKPSATRVRANFRRLARAAGTEISS